VYVALSPPLQPLAWPDSRPLACHTDGNEIRKLLRYPLIKGS